MRIGPELQTEESLLDHLLGTRINLRLILLAPGLIFLIGVYAWTVQLDRGMAVTGLGDQVFWGLNIVNFMFFIGVSLSGSFISALLRVLGCKWQIPLARIGEVITISALLNAIFMIVLNMGRPDRMANLLINMHLQSPLAWEVILITSYLVGTLIYLYLFLIPDLALYRDQLETSGPVKRYKVYVLFALGWENTVVQKRRLNHLRNLLTFMVIILAASLQFVTAWIYTATFRPGWSDSILAPQLIVNGLLSSVAMVTIITTSLRKIFHLDKYIKIEMQYPALGRILLALLLISSFFSIAQLLPEAYLLKNSQKELISFLLEQASPFWPVIIGGTIVPMLLICWPNGVGMAHLTLASILILIGTWINKAYLFIVGTLQVPVMPFMILAQYSPTWVEWWTSLAGMASFFILITLFCNYMPVIPIHEIKDLQLDNSFDKNSKP